MNNHSSVEAEQAWEVINHLTHEIGPAPSRKPSSAKKTLLLPSRKKLLALGYDCEKPGFFSLRITPKFSPYYSICPPCFFCNFQRWVLLYLPLIVFTLAIL